MIGDSLITSSIWKKETVLYPSMVGTIFSFYLISSLLFYPLALFVDILVCKIGFIRKERRGSY
jgi:hypothetical protein